MEQYIASVQSSFLELFWKQRAALENLSCSELADLRHRCEELKLAKTYSLRVSAEVNNAAIELIMDDRSKRDQEK